MALEIQDTHDSKKSTSTKPSKNRVHFILDESGSMGSCWDSTIDGFNEYIAGLKNDKNGNKYKISLTKFEGGNIETVFEDVHVNQVEPLTRETYCPCGMTNLNDAIGSVMTNMVKRKFRGKHNTLIIIMTDGMENMSQEWTADSVAKLVKEQEKNGWTVTFLGANIDTQKVSQTYAIMPHNAKSYSTQNMGATMRGLSESTVAYASSALVGCATTDFFAGTDDWTKDEDKSKSTDPNLTAAAGGLVPDSITLTTAPIAPFNLTGLGVDTLVEANIKGGRLYSAQDDSDLLSEAEKALKRMEDKNDG